MDSTVPSGAAVLLDFMREIETGKKGREAYDVLYGHRHIPKPLTTMTLDAVIAAGPSWSRAHGSSAAGGYQFMNATLKDLKRELGLSGTQILDPNLQDRLAYHLLKRRGYESYMAGKIDRTEFGKRLAMEWASMPVLAACKGAHRTLKRGQSYYAGDALNKSLVAPERFEAVLDAAKTASRQPDDPGPVSRPQPSPPGRKAATFSWGGFAMALIFIVVVAIILARSFL